MVGGSGGLAASRISESGCQECGLLRGRPLALNGMSPYSSSWTASGSATGIPVAPGGVEGFVRDALPGEQGTADGEGWREPHCFQAAFGVVVAPDGLCGFDVGHVVVPAAVVAGRLRDPVW